MINSDFVINLDLWSLGIKNIDGSWSKAILLLVLQVFVIVGQFA